MIKLLKSLFIMFPVLLFLSTCSTKNTSVIKMTLTPDREIAPEESYYLDDAASVIRSRLNSFGIEDENLFIKQEGNRIVLTITGADTGSVKMIGKIATATNRIGFWETYENEEVITFLMDANSRAAQYNLGDEYPPFKVPATGSTDTEIESLIQTADSTAKAEREDFERQNPLFALLRPMVNNEGGPMPSCLIGLAVAEDTLKVRDLLNRPEVTNMVPRRLKLMWSRDPYTYDESGRFFELHAIKVTNRSEEPVLDGSFISFAEVKTDRGGTNIRLQLTMNAEGAYRWKRFTSENINKCIAVTIDEKVVTYPRVMSEIAGGKTEITGDYSLEEAMFLASVFSSGGKEMKVKLSVSDVLIENPK